FEDQRLTYATLDAHANQIAHHLRALGVGPETVVGLCVERSLEMLIGLLGILKAGAAYLPLDPDYPPDRLAFMLADARAGVLLTQAALVDRLPPPAHIILPRAPPPPPLPSPSPGNTPPMSSTPRVPLVPRRAFASPTTAPSALCKSNPMSRGPRTRPRSKSLRSLSTLRVSRSGDHCSTGPSWWSCLPASGPCPICSASSACTTSPCCI